MLPDKVFHMVYLLLQHTYLLQLLCLLSYFLPLFGLHFSIQGPHYMLKVLISLNKLIPPDKAFIHKLKVT